MAPRAVLLTAAVGLTAALGSPAIAVAQSAEIRRAEEALLAAMARRDSLALERTLSPRFAMVSALSGGETTGRAAWLRGVLDRRSEDAGRVDGVEVSVHAPAVATAVVRVTWVVRDPGGPTPQKEEYLLTDTWVKRGRGWQLAARHSAARRPPPEP